MYVYNNVYKCTCITLICLSVWGFKSRGISTVHVHYMSKNAYSHRAWFRKTDFKRIIQKESVHKLKRSLNHDENYVNYKCTCRCLTVTKVVTCGTVTVLTEKAQIFGAFMLRY